MAPNMSHSVMCSAAPVIFEPNFVFFSLANVLIWSRFWSGIHCLERKIILLQKIYENITCCRLYIENLTFDCVQIELFGEKTEQIPLATEDFLGKNCICVLFGAFVYFVTTMIFPLKKCSRVQ